MKGATSTRQLLMLVAAAWLAACGGGVGGKNQCTSASQCPATGAGIPVCLGFCDGQISQGSGFLPDGGIVLEDLPDGGVGSSCPSGNVTGATCAMAQCVVSNCN
jgi:hypothetical protein